jgi:hypothetical protein
LQYGQKVQKLEHNGKKCYKTTAWLLQISKN